MTDHSLHGKRWSEEEDRKLIQWGSCFGDGYAYVAEHDLGRTEEAGRKRAAWLRKHRPEFVSEMVAIAGAEWSFPKPRAKQKQETPT